MLKRRLMTVLGIGLMMAAWVSPAFADPAHDALQDARKKLDSQSSYRLSMRDGAGTTDIEYAAPDAVRITKAGSVSVMANGAMYSNTGGGWGTVSSNTAILLLRRLVQQDALIAVSDTDKVTDDGVEMMDGVELHRYDILGEGTLKRTVWIDTHDGLPRQVQQGGDGAFTATYADFGKDFAITVPTTGGGHTSNSY